MSPVRRLALLAAAAAGAATFAQPVFAARPTSVALPLTLGTTHFLVHYQSADSTYSITQTQAGDAAALAERAYAAELADGYPAPQSDGALGGDSRIDIYVTDLAGAALGVATPDNPLSLQSSASIELDGSNPTQALDLHTIAHELFHLIQFSIWNTQSLSDYWLDEASAEWMGFRVDGYGVGDGLGIAPPDLSLDCRDATGGYQCDRDLYNNDGYSRWPFFEYLAERFGPSFVKDVYAQGSSGTMSAVQALASALTARGTTLAGVYDDWTVVDMTSAYSVSLLQNLAPVPYTTVQTGTKSGTVASTTIDVNHLSTRYVEFDRGAGSTSDACYAATLGLTVALPAGTSSQPVFWWKQTGSAPVGLSVNGSTATASVPWDTCTWSSGAGFLSLPNASQSVDAADFHVTATLTVTATPASSVAPPPPVSVNTTVVPVSSTETAPTLTAYGPELIRLAAGTRVLRIIVESNAEGSVQAALGSAALGSAALRPGNNELWFALPQSLLRSLRRAAGVSSLLVLTPVSPQGHVLGPPVTRQVTIAPPRPTQGKRRK